MTAISKHKELNKILCERQSEFNKEEVHHCKIGDENIKTVQVRFILHEILSHFIFTQEPCMNLLHRVTNKEKPTISKWKTDSAKWCHLTADPYHIVSLLCDLI